MPLIVLAYLALLAGMLAGLHGQVVPVLLLAAAGIGWAVLRRAVVPLAAALLLGAGAVAAAAAREHDARCRRMGAGRARLEVELSTAAHPRGIARGTWHYGACRVPATIEVSKGSAPAGALAALEATVRVGQRGLVLRDARILHAGPAATLVRWRAAVGARIDSLFAGDAPLARALIIAEQGSLPPRLRDQYADAGLVHLLSVSGLHVAIVAGAVALILAALRVPRAMATIAGALLTAAYVVLIGMPPAALRAGTMLAAMALGRLLQRPVSPWALLALGAMLPLHDPRVAGDLGYQLSVAGMSAVIASGAVDRRLLAHRLDGWRRTLTADLVTALLAALVTGPLVAAAFGRLSLISPLANLVAAPVVAFAQPALFLAVLLSPLDALAPVVAEGARVPLALLEWVATHAAAVPHAAVPVNPRSVVALLLLAAGFAIVAACAMRRPWPALVLALAAAAGACWIPSRGSGEAELHVLDVGQGDALAIRTMRGRWILVDAGPSWEGGDAGRAKVVPYLRRLGGDVALLILSHPHADHAGGAASVMRALRPAKFLDAGFPFETPPYLAALALADSIGMPYRQARRGDRFIVDEVAVDILAPDEAMLDAADGPNNASIVARIQVGTVRFLLTGDAERQEEGWLVSEGRDLRADVLKAGHHGSRTSSAPFLLDAVRPRLALVSVGALNRYGHPSPEVVHELARRQAVVMRTDAAGTIVVRTDGFRIRAETGEDSWELSRGSWRE